MGNPYPNIPKEAFPFQYGSDEWDYAHLNFRLEFNRTQHELLKNCSNQVPDEVLLNSLLYIHTLPNFLTPENLSNSDGKTLSIFQSKLEISQEYIIKYLEQALIQDNDVMLKELIKAKHLIKIQCPLGLPIAPDTTSKYGGVTGITQTVRKIVYDWFGNSPPCDWMVTYKEISKRHSSDHYRPANDDLKKYLKKLGFANLIDL